MKKVFRKPGERGGRNDRISYRAGTWPVTPVSAVLKDGMSVVGPFPASVTPSHTGMYRREKDNKNYWSFWDGRAWGMMGKNLARAVSRKSKPSSLQTGCRWYGITA